MVPIHWILESCHRDEREHGPVWVEVCSYLSEIFFSRFLKEKKNSDLKPTALLEKEKEDSWDVKNFRFSLLSRAVSNNKNIRKRFSERLSTEREREMSERNRGKWEKIFHSMMHKHILTLTLLYKTVLVTYLSRISKRERKIFHSMMHKHILTFTYYKIVLVTHVIVSVT